ncbi:MAG: hypothetical protein AVDCRST_MAG38-1004, partial [uncultured Solirubrobacteraceae bacterium]
ETVPALRRSRSRRPGGGARLGHPGVRPGPGARPHRVDACAELSRGPVPGGVEDHGLPGQGRYGGQSLPGARERTRGRLVDHPRGAQRRPARVLRGAPRRHRLGRHHRGEAGAQAHRARPVEEPGEAPHGVFRAHGPVPARHQPARPQGTRGGLDGAHLGAGARAGPRQRLLLAGVAQQPAPVALPGDRNADRPAAHRRARALPLPLSHRTAHLHRDDGHLAAAHPQL